MPDGSESTPAPTIDLTRFADEAATVEVAGAGAGGVAVASSPAADATRGAQRLRRPSCARGVVGRTRLRLTMRPGAKATAPATYTAST